MNGIELCPKVVFFLSNELLIFIQLDLIILSKVRRRPIKLLSHAPEQQVL